MIYLIAFSTHHDGHMRAKILDEACAEMIAAIFTECAETVYRVGLVTYLLHTIKFYNTSTFLAEQFGKEWVNEEDL